MAKQLFTIYDYETNEVMYQYLTNDADKCREILGKVDDVSEEENPELYDEKYIEGWQAAFEAECERQGVVLEKFEYEASYHY